ncbi:MAG: zf-TFIIB domain-containing protein [Hyphomonadaceae bacterium]|nr:zf-TFIIB domain-containing protein [Hyphomonadaceae bacterium]
MCPNCNASMNEVKRSDVAFDMCPTCRGVWLDRGELEKIIDGARGEIQALEAERQEFRRDPKAYERAYEQRQPQQYSQPPQRPHDSYGERGEYGEQGYDPRRQGAHGRRRRGGFDLLDIFD